jgi:elongation factor Ts
MVTIDQIKQLREETGISILECKKALEAGAGDIAKAREILKKWGKDVAAKKGQRSAQQGIIDSYIHPNKKIGVLIKLNCESDFVAKSDDFRDLAHELCLQFAAVVCDPESRLNQPWIKDSSKTVKELIEAAIAKMGENIVLSAAERFVV